MVNSGLGETQSVTNPKLHIKCIIRPDRELNELFDKIVSDIMTMPDAQAFFVPFSAAISNKMEIAKYPLTLTQIKEVWAFDLS
jgi:hypothetical protein